MCYKFCIVWILGIVLVTGQSYNEVEMEDISVENLPKPPTTNLNILTGENLQNLVPELEEMPVETLLRPVSEGENSTDFDARDFLVSWRTRRHLRKILNQMPCGWPEHDIPPLDPYIDENLTFVKSDNYTSYYYNFQPLRIDGLSKLDIDKFNIFLALKKVYFDFNFSNITATGKFNVSTLIAMEEQIGLKLGLKAKGSLDIELQNLRVTGTVRYKLPFLFGTAKIYDLRVTVSLGNVHSRLKGTINYVPITKKLNNIIEKKLLDAVNLNGIFISSMVAQLLEPRVNAQLKGKNMLDVIIWSMTDTHDTCVPENIETDLQNLQRLLF